eukprot:CAMPEP_0201520006 /NCGR_PEP_ID=MMETSP0161_2-20130828/10419_1 /ASSEMBLY_ACC=CAM_ASM_000251 /TAXON_ID=180227 /ORGANISM="Neoparamoeba aestuarina, Strain SoJaBio B1-5/56/2" /LENGTH=437 /DNA_ID=CAMNT_0047918227 /DNA_START=51 /DNA_END=1364 /DNA_ORIENTATION=+
MAFSPGKRRAGEEEKDDDWRKGKGAAGPGSKERSTGAPSGASSPTVPPFASRSYSVTPMNSSRNAITEREKAGPSSLSPPLNRSVTNRAVSPNPTGYARKEEKKDENWPPVVEGEVNLYEKFTAGKPIYLCFNDEYFPCAHEPLSPISLPSLAPLLSTTPASTPFSPSLPLFPPASPSNPFSFFFFLSPQILAQRISLHQHGLLASVDPRELWNSAPNYGSLEPLVAHAKLIQHIVVLSLVNLVNGDQRRLFLSKMVQVAVNFFNLNNYLGAWAISTAIAHPSVARMKKTMKSLETETQESLQAINYLLSPERDYYIYRKAIKRARPPLVPLGFPIMEGKGLNDNKDSVDVSNLVKTAEWIFAIRRGKVMDYSLTSQEDHLFGFKSPCFEQKSEDELMKMSMIAEPDDPSQVIQDLVLKNRALEREIARLKGEKVPF